MNTLATVVNLTGRAWAVAADGERREIKVGDRLRGDEMLITEPGARVDLDFGDNQVLTFLGEQQQTVGEAAEAAQAELPPSTPRPAAEDRGQPQAQPAQASGEPEGHNFVQLVRINEIIEADGITPLTVARIQEVLRPLGMSLPDRGFMPDEWREHRGGDERHETGPAARKPGLSIELQGAGPDGVYNEEEIGPDGTVPAEVTLDDRVREGDQLVIKDGKGNILLDRPVTAEDLRDGVTVEVPVEPGDRNVTVEATVTTPQGFTGTDRDDKLVDNDVPGVSVELQGAGPDGVYNEEEIGPDGTVPAEVTLDDKVEIGDVLKVTDKDGNVLLERPVTQDDLDNGVTVQVPVSPGDTEVPVTATITDPAGNSGTDTDNKPVDNIVPTVTVELQGAGPDGVYNEEEIGPDGTVPALVTPGPTVEVGDNLVVTDKDGNILLERPVTQDDLDNGVIVQVPVAPGDTEIPVTATITDPAGNSGTDTDNKPVDNTVPTVSVELQGAGPDGVYNEEEIGPDGTVPALVIPGPTVEVGDTLVVTDKDGNILWNRPVTQDDLDNGVTVQVPVSPGDTEVPVTATITDPAGNSGTDTDNKPVDNIVPTVTVELQGAGPDGVYNEEEIGPDGTVPALVTPGPTVEVGDTLVVTDKDGNVLLERPVTQDDLDNGVTVQVPVAPGDTEVPVTATITDPAGNSGTDTDSKPVDNLPPVATLIVDQNDMDADQISLDISTYFNDAISGTSLTYSAAGLPTGLSIDPVTGVISGTIDHSASQRDSDSDGQADGQYGVTITVTDEAGNSTDATFTWTVGNPPPVAENDTNTTLEDTPLHVDAANGVLANDSDPDGDEQLTVVEFTVEGQTYNAGEIAVILDVGELLLNDDGSYHFVPEPNWHGDVPTVTYTVSDGEGGIDTAELNITVTPTDDPVDVDVPIVDDATIADGNVNDHVVFESGLANGSAPEADDLKVESSFTLTAPDGLGNSGAVVLTYTNINGETRTLNLGREQLEQLGNSYQVLDTQYGKLELNGYTENADGTITIDYQYTLERAPQVSGDDSRDEIGIRVTDIDGSTDEATLSIKIVDDAPAARDDSNSITEDVTAPVTGNVIANGSTGDVADILGADGAEITGITSDNVTANSSILQPNGDLVIEGQYGTLTISPDGSYSYELDNTNLAIQGLGENEALEEVFSYTLTDGDNDSSDAKLTITINGSNDDVTVKVPDPTDPTDPNYPVVNDPADPNDPARGNVNDHMVFESGLHGGSATDVADTRVESSFTLSALDGLDDTAAITFEVAGNTLILRKAEVEDLGNNSQSITTEYGELLLNGYTLNADGTITVDYEYTLTSAPDNTAGDGESTDDTIRITVNDRDSDSDSQDLVIRIIDDAPTAMDDANAITEDDLSIAGNVITGGSANDVADTQGADGATVTDISSTSGNPVDDSDPSGILVIEGEYGTLTIEPDGSYTYELNNDSAEVNKLKVGETLTEEFTYTLTDTDGDSDTATLTITINGNTDGAPTIVPEDVNGPEVPADITTQGHVTVHERGLTGSDSSHINDGSVTISAPDGLESITIGGVPVDLTQLAALDPTDPSTHIEIDTPQGKLTLTGFDVTDAVGGVPTQGELQFTYELEEVQTTPADPADPDAGRNSTETIPLEVTDAGGGAGTGNLVINIIDDVPVAVGDENAITEDELLVTGNVIGGPSASVGDEADTEGADGATVTDIGNAATGNNMTALPNGDLVIEGEYGTLTIRPDGFYTYELNNDHPDVNALRDGDDLQDVFTYTLTDGDGDSDTADLTITINGRTDGAPTIVPEDVNGPDVPVDITTQGHVTVHERGLTGSDSSHINDGSVTISAPDGLESITIGGVPVDLTQLAALDPTDPSTHIEIDTPQGKLTLTGFDVTDAVGGVPTQGELQFTYELEEVQTTPADPADPDAGRNSTETIPLEVTDAGGGTGTGDLVINIIDDVPVAEDDVNAITEDELAVSGNVIGGSGASAGDEADTEGADGATVTDISSTSGNPVDDSDPSGILVIEGEYGTLTIEPDGSYTYELNNDSAEVNKLKAGETLTEEFTYTLTDADGDSDTARLTITINGNTDGTPSITPDDVNGNGAINGHNTVQESGLAGGSTAGDDSNIVDGAIQISAGDGLASITIGGQSFTLAELQDLSSSPSAAIPVDGGILVLTGFTGGDLVGGVPTSGTLEYSYTLTGERTHSGGEDQSLLLDIPLSVTDAGNETANGTLTIQVMDDVPTAVADIGNVIEGATLTVNAADGVLDNDTSGADGWAGTGAVVGVAAGDTNANSSGGVGGRIDGQYGYLILNADGSYAYVSTADATTADAVDVFTYTVRDGDGDLSHTTLTINVSDVSLNPENTTTSVNESGLVGGTSEGDDDHIATGQVTLSPGLEVIPGSGTTEHGTFTIDQDGSYTYTLTGNTSGDNTTDSFTYVSTDANGNTVTNTVIIEIIDDEPVAVNDENAITEDELAVSGNVIGGPSASTGDEADTQGADGATVTEIGNAATGNSMITLPNGDLVIEGQYGTLTIRPDGFYTYELDNNHPDVNGLKDGDDLREVFTYTLTDGDGDSDSAELAITINGRTDGVPGVSITDHNGLEVGHNSIAEDATAPVTGEFTVTAPDGLESISVAGTTITEAGLADLTTAPVSIPGAEGTLTLTGYDPVTGKVSYEYQQTGNSKDHSGGDNSVTDSFPITVTDRGGDTSAPSDLEILITDTAPAANPDIGSIDEDGSPLSGNLITDPGAGEDEIGADITTVTNVSSNNEPGNTASNAGGTLVIDGEYGTLTILPNGDYTYELHDSAKVNALKDGDTPQDVFTYTITDSDGDADSTTLTITINGNTDGAPTITPEDGNDDDPNDFLTNGHATVYERGLMNGDSSGSHITDGSITITAPDGLGSLVIGGTSVSLAQLEALDPADPDTHIEIDTPEGKLILTEFVVDPADRVGGVPTEGELKFSYELEEVQNTPADPADPTVGRNNSEQIPLTVIDAGGDEADGTLIINIIDDTPTAAPDNGTVTEGETLTVDADNGVLANDTAGADGWAGTGAVVGVAAGDTNANSSGGVGGRIDGQYGYLVLNADGSYEYISTADAVTGDEVDIFTYTVRDDDGDLSHTTLTINVTDVSLPPIITPNDSVNESGLAGGSTEGDNSHTTTGQVILPPGLEVVPDSGTSTHGTFTIDQDGSYTYILTGNTSGNTTTDSFTYVTTDANGNTVTNTVTINIIDDAPVAEDDVNSVPAGSYAEVTGELINGGLGGAGKDTEGADGATVTSVVNTPVGEPAGTPVAVSTDGSTTTINGQYGVLTVEADGSYSYQRNPGTPGGVQDVFSYTLTDSDGDDDTATLTINIGDATPTISDLTPKLNGGELTFEEKHLADGSAPDSAQLTKTGDFTISSPDGIGSLTVGGVTVIANGVLTSTTTVTTPQGHTLEITGYDPATGRITYEYTLTDREHHDQSSSDTELFDDIPVVLTDRDGDSVNDTLSVRIVDDVPQANDDTRSITEDGPSVTGNVIEGDPDGGVADTKGADGATVTDISSTSGNPVDDSDPNGVLVIEGEYGTLTIEPDGSYEYVLNNENAEVNKLKTGQTLAEEFTYTLTDADGDSDTAKLTITIDGHTDGAPSIVPADDNGNGAIDGHNTVQESGLAGGSTAGDGSHITSGSIQISADDGLASITIGGRSFTLVELQDLSVGNPSAAIPVEGGTLVLTGFTGGDLVGGVPTSGTLQYTYTLTGERTHSAQGDDAVLLDIPLSVTDAGNETVNGTLTIQVVDDVPTAVNDTAEVAAGEFELVENGNVLTNDTEGADGARVTGVGHESDTSETAVPGTGNLVIDGDYGKLTIHSDGSYSYQRNPGTPGDVQDVFTYTITDGDGDTASAELTINIADSAPAVDIPAAGSGSTTVYESGLPDGSDNIPGRATTSGSIEFNSADGLGTVSLGGHTLTETDQTFSTTGPDGSLTARYEYDPVTGKGSIHYSYTLEGTTDGDNTSVSFPVEITDQDGDAAPAGNLVINIVDDVPTARPDEETVTEGGSVSGDVLGNDDAGADGWHDNGNAVVGVVSGTGGPVENGNVGTSINGTYGTLTLNADGSYTYQSNANAVTGDEQDVFTYTVRDADGDLVETTLTINVNDVTGISRDTTGTVDEAGLSAGSDSSSDKETTGGSLNLADGWTVDPSSVGDQSSGIGTLTINADGSYSYTLTSRTEDIDGEDEIDEFTYTARDQYGNTVTNTVIITIIDDIPSVTLTGNALGEVQVDETSMGTSASADFSGAFNEHFGADGDNGDGLVYTLEVDTAATGLVDTETGDPIVLVESSDGLTVTGHVGDDIGPAAFTISVDGNGNVTLTQTRPLHHTNPNDHDDVIRLPDGSLKLTATATDGDGDTDAASVDIGGRFSFRDDGPSIGAAPAPGEVDEAYLPTGSGEGTDDLSTVAEADLNVDFGADGQGALVFSADQAVLRAWLDASGNDNIDLDIDGDTITATRGGQSIFTVTLAVDGSGQASYRFELQGSMLHRDSDQNHELTFDYEAIDGDGDRASGSFVVEVVDDNPRTEIEISMLEDQSHGPFTTSADARPDNITISTTDGGPAIPGTPNGSNTDYDVGHGTVTVHEDGRITYTPLDDYSNHDNPDEFYVTVAEDHTGNVTTKVIVNVIPVADAPELTVDASSVTTDEDVAIGLGLNAPETTDDTDRNGSGTPGDNPERLGPITLSGFPAGAQLLDGTDSNSVLHSFDSSGSITIVISDNVDGPHFNGATGTLTLTTAQYEALGVLPPAESSANFTVDVSVTSHEVDESGNPLTVDVNGDPIAGAESTVSVTVNVQAVTDGIDLTIHNGDDNYVDADSIANAVTLPAFDEDGSINLKDYLQITLDETGDGNSGADTDGSEQRWFEVSGVPVGWTVDGVLITTPDQSVSVEIPNSYNGASPSLPDIVIEPPADFSGDLDGVRVTLHAQDQDDDGPNPVGTQISDSVYFNLRVNPQGGDVTADDVTTEEDMAVAFLQHVRVTDTGTGSEIITEVEFSLPDGWTLVELPAGQGTDWAMTGTGTTADPYIITSPNGTDLEEVLGDFTVLPPAHSSKDEDIVVRVTSTDTNTVDGDPVSDTDYRDLTITVEVTPKGERVEDIGNADRDTDGNGQPDLTMTDGRDYTTPGAEDEWFMLGQEADFNLKDDWSNEDGRGLENGGTVGSGSEETFALLTPNLIAGDGSQADASGSEFRWGPNGEYSEIFDGVSPVEVPLEYLDTLQFKAAPHFSGMFEIRVQAKTVDFDEDYPGDESRADTQISGEAWLTNVLIAPRADTVTATVTARVEGNEDERMPLSIRPKSSDPSETFEVDIDGIPDGATLWYDGHEITAESVDDQALIDAGITVTDNGDGTWKVEFADFDPEKGGAMEIQAPLDSNEEFDLKVTARSVDTLEVPDDPDSPYISKSDPHSLDIKVAPKGVADPAEIELIDYDDPGVEPFTEADVDANGGIALTDLIISAELKDNDTSEVLTFKVSGLPEGFSIEGGTFMGGTGTGREWSLTKDQLANAKLVTPPNFNGIQSFELSSVTTENDGDSLTKQHQVEVRVSPSPEATINLGASLDEDASSRLDFSIQHRNGDTDEVLSEVWINASDLAGLDDLILTYGQGGQSLADAAADVTNPHIVLEDGYYKLSGDAIDNIYAQGRENWHGDASFGVHYVITDRGNDGMADVSEGTGDTYNVTVNPITDQVTLAIPDADISMNGAGNTTINLNIGNTGSDYDGSEQLTRVILDNVPDGVVVVATGDYDVDYVGDGTWVLIPTAGSFNGTQQLDIRLQVHGSAGGLEDHEIGVTVVTEDAGNGQETRASQNVTLTTTFPEGDPDDPAIIVTWEQTDFEPTEDIAFTLDQAIEASIDDTGVVDSGFTVTLTDLPPGTEVSGMTRTVVDGQEVWSASGTGGDAELQALLENITVTPPADFNHNQGSFDYNATLTTHTPSGARAQDSIRVEQEVEPVTDEADITITMDAVEEGQDLAIHIDVSNSADDPNWTLIDGKLYLTLNEPAGMAGGQLLDSDGNPLATEQVEGVDGVPDGIYYVIDVDSDNTVDLTYRPAGPHVSGDITLEATVVGREAGADNTVRTTTTQDGSINPVNSGYDFAVADVVGNEPATAGGKEEAIQLNVTGSGLVDDDGSESVLAVLLKNLPNDFLVFVGDDAASAELAELANNAGGEGTNTWLLELDDDGNLPNYIAILPPKNWSGTLEDLELVVISGEGALSEERTDSQTFSVTVEPVANGLTIAPTPSFGREGEIIGLNLNARFEDLRKAGATDESVERATVELKGLGEHAAIYVGGDLIMDRVEYDEVNDVYTISGLTQGEIDQLGFVQAAGDINNLQVRARTEEYDASTGQPVAGVDPSDWTHGTDDDWDGVAVTTNITAQFGTSGADELLWTGQGILNGRGGDDTVQLRFGESLDGDELAAHLRNIEIIDLSIDGENRIENLSIEDVFAMTDDRNTLQIFGDEEDSVGLAGDWGAGVDNGAFTTYTAMHNGSEVKLEVQNILID
ncbi:VCBS domain-containing protein [Pseudomonas sp. MYb185]|uniref:VCBS domain-containing protein n=1 Tax=Pseudomonas sp. MYb185 TaxID=1848729 RepID=UPI000CFC0BE8|nr:VCBS domain-containing protein [Pseudomonas sp. MYb185]PRB82896.1 hypothetical protein CQ007_06255 [Pseudomonas sp. MYb185]